MNGDEDSVRQALMTEVALLDKGTIFSVVEFGADGITGWEVWQDKAGVPRARHWPCEPASDRTDPSVLYEHRLRPLTTGRRLLIIFDALHELYADAFEVLRAARPEAPVYYCTVPLASLLRDVIAEIPLTCWYELVVLRQTESRRLVLDSRQLFPPGAQRGYREQFRIRCEPSDEHGTVFAVVAVRLAASSLSRPVHRHRPGRLRADGGAPADGACRFPGAARKAANRAAQMAFPRQRCSRQARSPSANSSGVRHRGQRPDGPVPQAN